MAWADIPSQVQTTIIVIGVLIAAVVIGVGFLIWYYKGKKTEAPLPTEPLLTAESSEQVTGGFYFDNNVF
jgi:hypothetical protein